MSFSEVVKHYINPFDERYEDLKIGSEAGTDYRAIIRDCMAGLVVAVIAIPMAMGFAMASGLKPGQGIVGGAIAGLIGALFGGSKYQVYGPTAAFIPVMHAIMALNKKGGLLFVDGLDDDEIFRRGHGLLVLVSLIAAMMLWALGLTRSGSLVTKVPRCIVVGFTMGIAVTIAVALVEDALGVPKSGVYHGFAPKIMHVWEHIGDVNVYALVIAIFTLVCTQALMSVSIFFPGALLAITLSTVLAQTAWSEKHLQNVFDHYGHIPQSMAFTPPLFHLGNANPFQALGALLYYSMAITFIGAVGSLLCARMGDSLAENKGTPFSPNKELWGQGWVNAIVPLLNGFPHTGALARTAVNIKLGAVSPLAGIMKCFLKLAMAFVFARWLELMPMASIAGLLWYVALNMVSQTEIALVHSDGGLPHVLAMAITAILVIATDFLVGAASGMIIFAVGSMLGEYLPPWMTTMMGDQGAEEEEKAPILKNSA